MISNVHVHVSHVHTCTCTCIHQSEQLASELEEQQAVAEGRLKEIEAMSQHLAEARKELERLKLDRQIISESDVRDSPVFKSLQTQYSIVCQGEDTNTASSSLCLLHMISAKTLPSSWSKNYMYYKVFDTVSIIGEIKIP